MGSSSRRWSARRGALACVALAVLVATATGHIRLRYQTGSSVLFWGDPSNVSIVINSDGSDNIADGSHETAIRSAIEAWNGGGGTSLRLIEDLRAGSQARRDWQSDDIHLVLFDENNTSGFFAGANGTVAITPVAFFTSGRIIDADVLFNGQNFSFTTSGVSGRFDVQDLAAHELGHLIGFDHSGVCGATMYPYVDQSVILHRSLSLDERRGLRHMYPGATFARISGRVVREGAGTPVHGAHVVARDDGGRVAGAILTNLNGDFTLQGLDSGSYTVYADPLDQPVSQANFGSGRIAETDFESTTLGTISTFVGTTAAMGDREVGADVAASLGRVSDNYPLRVISGQTRTIVVRGNGLVNGSTITASDPTLSLTNVNWFGTAVHLDVTVPAQATPGHFDLTLTTPSQGSDVLVGGIEVTPPSPSVSSVTPTTGLPEGGAQVTITGAHFRAGLRVVLGDRIYRDGGANGCVVVDENTITLTTLETIAGDHDVVVIDSTGVEGRAFDAFSIAVAPTLTATFPGVGSSLGGTNVTLSGEDFVPGSTVTINGTVQANVTVASPTRIRLVTSPGVIGGPYIMTVTAPSGDSAETAFTYVAQQDPDLDLISPSWGDEAGGTSVTMHGSGFTPDSRVVIGASARTGGGGIAVPTTFVDANTLRIVTPPSTIGARNVMVRDASTGQASVLESAFVYTGEESYDEGGCGAVVPPGPPTWRQLIGGSGWIVLLLVLSALRAHRARALPVTVRA